MTTETIETDAGDHIAEFARKHRISETELRSYIAEGVKATRWFLEQVGIVDDFPRAPAEARAADIEAGK